VHCPNWEHLRVFLSPAIISDYICSKTAHCIQKG